MRDVYRPPINSQTGFVKKLAMYNFAGGADGAVACASYSGTGRVIFTGPRIRAETTRVAAH
jgi:hypothetical protein